MHSDKKLFIVGLGYTGMALACHMRSLGWSVHGSVRNADKISAAEKLGGEVVHWPGVDDTQFQEKLAECTALLITIPPGDDSDTLLNKIDIRANINWLGYLSSTGVYGDHGGDWVDEESICMPSSDRTQRRLHVEQTWQKRCPGKSHIFRLGGIYGVGRSAVEQALSGKPVIRRDGQFFSRIHVDDIAGIVAKSLLAPMPGIYNVVDDYPCDAGEVLTYAYNLINHPRPPVVSFDDAKLSPMALSFYEDNRRVRNEKVKRVWQYSFQYPTYREGLQACLRAIL